MSLIDTSFLKSKIIVLFLSIVLYGCAGSGGGSSSTSESSSSLLTPGDNGTLSVSEVSTDRMTLNWKKASDATSPASNLEYLAYYSTANELETVASIKTKGKAVGNYSKDISSVLITSLTPSTPYYFNVIVRNATGDQFSYKTLSESTLALAEASPTDNTSQSNSNSENVSDTLSPTAGDNGTLSVSSIASNRLIVAWTQGSDESSSRSSLQYRVYYSTSSVFDSVSDVEKNGTPVGAWESGITQKQFRGLSEKTSYYLNLLVKDESGNKTSYSKQTAVTPASKIYIADTQNNRVVSIDNMSGGNWFSYGSLGSGTEQLNQPSGLYVDISGKIYVADPMNHRVVRMDNITGSGWIAYGESGSGNTQLRYPESVFVDVLGIIYISDTKNNRIVRIEDMLGKNRKSYGSYGSGIGQFDNPSSLFVDDENKIYIVDTGNNRIVRIDDMNGNNWESYGVSGSHGGELSTPTSVYVSVSGKIYIADQNNDRIVSMDDMNGSNLSLSRSTPSISAPHSIQVTPSGKIYLTEFYNHRITLSTSMTGTSSSYGSFGSDNGTFNRPSGLFIH